MLFSAESTKKSEVDLTSAEAHVLTIADLHSIGKLPDGVITCDGGLLLKLAWESGIASKYPIKNRSVDEKRALSLSFFAKLHLNEEKHRQLLESSVLAIRLEFGRAFRREIEKRYLSIFQLSLNARRLTGKCEIVFTLYFFQMI